MGEGESGHGETYSRKARKWRQPPIWVSGRNGRSQERRLTRFSWSPVLGICGLLTFSLSKLAPFKYCSISQPLVFCLTSFTALGKPFQSCRCLCCGESEEGLRKGKQWGQRASDLLAGLTLISDFFSEQKLGFVPKYWFMVKLIKSTQK